MLVEGESTVLILISCLCFFSGQACLRRVHEERDSNSDILLYCILDYHCVLTFDMVGKEYMDVAGLC